MKSPIIISLIILLLTPSLMSQQTTFEFITTSKQKELISNLIEDSTGNIYLFNSIVHALDEGIRHGSIINLNRCGILIDSISYFYPGKSISFSSVFHNDQNSFDVLTFFYDDENTFYQSGYLVLRMDSSLNLTEIASRSFKPDLRFRFFYANRDTTGKSLMGGVYLNEGSSLPNVFVYVLGSNYDSIAASLDLGTGLPTFPSFLKDNKYWFFIQGLFEYMILDHELNIVKTQDVPQFIGSQVSLKWDSDSSFYLIGNLMFPPPSQNIAFIRQYDPIDTTAHLFRIWRVTDSVDYPATQTGIDFRNKDTIFAGGTRNLNIYNPTYATQPSWFVVLQMDSLLNVRWERFYGGDAYYKMDRVYATLDGGCIVAGTRYDYLNSTEQQTDIIVLKLNNEGLLVGNHELNSGRLTEAIVFPNPGKDVMHLRIAAQHPFSVLTLYDLGGRQVLQQNINGQEAVIRTTGLAPGTYIYELSAPTGLYETGKWVKQ
jgi:hypothetical protein